MLELVNNLYEQNQRNILLKHVKCDEISAMAASIENYRRACQSRFENDEHLLEFYNFIKRVFFKFCSSLLPYHQAVSEEIVQTLIRYMNQLKQQYPVLFEQNVIPLAKATKTLTETEENKLTDFICKHLNESKKISKNIALVTKRALSAQEREHLRKNLSPLLNIIYYTENSYRKGLATHSEVIFIGGVSYFSSFATSVFKSPKTHFISYDVFENRVANPTLFQDIPSPPRIYTIYQGVSYDKPLDKLSSFTLEEEKTAESAIQKVLLEQKVESTNSAHVLEASIIFLENDRFLFATNESKIRVFSPYEKSQSIKQITFKDLEEDNYIVIRNERDSRLIAEVADQEVLKDEAVLLRSFQKEWKDRLRHHVSKKGVSRVSSILRTKYLIKTASPASVRIWCGDDLICPRELEKLLRVLKYEETKVSTIYAAMQKIQVAHREAGRIISKRLMSEINSDITGELQEKGCYTFSSKAFNGASFNIERVVSISQSKYNVMSYNIMKLMNA